MLKSVEKVTFQKRRTWAPCFGRISRKLRRTFTWFLLVSVAAGCAGPKGSGLYEPLPSQEQKKVLEELKRSWQDYNVYCDGPASGPGALIFDPRNDDRNLVGYRYIKLSKEEAVRFAIVQIEFNIGYHPLLYRIFDEEKNFYGYVLLAKDLPVPKRVDQKTLELPSYQSTFHMP